MDLELGSIDTRWLGWQLRGRHLIAPDRQLITQERLHGLLRRDKHELTGIKVVISDFPELRVDDDAAG